MSEQPYKQPPITEAVIEICFTAPVSAERIAAISGDFQSLYPFEQRIADVQVQVNLPPTPEAGTANTQTIETPGHKRSSLDQTEILVLRPHNFVVAQLAPYPGWHTFFERFRRDWTLWKRLMSYRKISRIGARYLNRIDIPTASGKIDYEQYINIYPHLPDLIPNVQGYGVQIIVDMPDISCRMTLNSLSTPSPLLGHGGFIIDQDIYNEQNTPQNDDEIYTLLNVVRVRKNDVFEACITSRARELFKPWQD